jgi:HSP20 family protein
MDLHRAHALEWAQYKFTGQINDEEAISMTVPNPRQWMWAEACAMIERAEQLHRQFFRPGAAAVAAANWEPPVDVFESSHALTILAALPGVNPEDISISLESGVLQVTGARRLPEALRGTAIRRLEIPHGRFHRRIGLPEGEWEIGRSSLENGCLSISLVRSR